MNRRLSWSYKSFVGYEGFRYSDGFKSDLPAHQLEKTVTSAVWSPVVWKDGVRCKRNFVSADLLALDFDTPGELTMWQLIDSIADHDFIVGITKSHGLAKKGVVCDRYRLVIPFERQITCLDEYEYNLELALEKWDWADPNATDGARFFYPCQRVVAKNYEGYFRWPVLAAKQREKVYSKTPANGQIPAWVLAFINRGLIYKGSRNMTIFSCACELIRQGYDDRLEELLERAPISWTGVSLRSITKSARSKYGRGEI